VSHDFDAAIRSFWAVRAEQEEKQRTSGKTDAGTRGSVTGGGHLAALTEAIAALFREAGFPDESIRFKGKITLPGFYRATKDWDLVVVHEGILVAAIELKSQVGSVSNNFNNRSEEAIGNAVDIWRAYEDGTFGDVRPWLGFVFIFETTPRVKTPVRDIKSSFAGDPIFKETSYVDRYRILFQRLTRERLYDATCFVTSESGGGLDPEHVPELSLANLAAAIAGRAAYVNALLDQRK